MVIDRGEDDEGASVNTVQSVAETDLTETRFAPKTIIAERNRPVLRFTLVTMDFLKVYHYLPLMVLIWIAESHDLIDKAHV